MYQAFYYDLFDELRAGEMIILMSFGTLRDAFNYARKWRISQRFYTDADVFISYTHGSGSKLLGDLGSVAMEHFADKVQ